MSSDHHVGLRLYAWKFPASGTVVSTILLYAASVDTLVTRRPRTVREPMIAKTYFVLLSDFSDMLKYPMQINVAATRRISKINDL
ncbi:hypothetical protein ASG35_09895 [Burkholderia sp. Leaf177]|nr:hypothetical protein ASG35_09895 [Burkholderia sp. Leaf177]